MDRPILNALEGGGDAPKHPTEEARAALIAAARVEEPAWEQLLLRMAASLPPRELPAEHSAGESRQGLRLVGS